MPQLAFYPIPSYSLPLGSIISKKTSNFLVAEKSISVSNLVNGTTRLQPVVLQVGQIAGLIASESIKNNISTNEIDIRDIQTKILNNGGYIQPYLDVEKNHPFFKAYQRIGSTGILRATGLNIGWSNQTWFYPEKSIDLDQLLKDLGNYYDLNKNPLSDLRTKTIFKWISLVQNQEIKNQQKIWNALGLSNFNSDRKINRGEFAIILDYFLNPFNNFKVDVKGNIIKNEY